MYHVGNRSIRKLYPQRGKHDASESSWWESLVSFCGSLVNRFLMQVRALWIFHFPTTFIYSSGFSREADDSLSISHRLWHSRIKCRHLQFSISPNRLSTRVPGTCREKWSKYTADMCTVAPACVTVGSWGMSITHHPNSLPSSFILGLCMGTKTQQDPHCNPPASLSCLLSPVLSLRPTFFILFPHEKTSYLHERLLPYKAILYWPFTHRTGAHRD